jgi:pSer/pThr/pTyr-binding forkhead associated (FHA) protein
LEGTDAATPPPAEGGAAANLRMVVTDGKALGAGISVEHEIVLGRDAPGDGSLGEDPELSRRNTRVWRADDGFMIEDLGSTNGTFLNARRIDGPERLAVGDVIQVGATTLTVEAVTGPFAEPEPEQPTAPSRAAPPATASAELAVGQVAVRLEIDFEAREARVGVGEDGATIRLVERDGRWVAEPG